LLAALGSKDLSSQTYYPFPNDSAFWEVKLSCQVTYCPPNAMEAPYQTIQKGDTVLNGLIYHKLYDKLNSNALHSFYRESNKKIYSKYPLGGKFGNDTAEFVLYDFNLQLGDSFIVKVPSSWIGPFLTKQPVIYLNSTGTISINSSIHKTYSFSSNNCTPCISSINIQWIEGVGDVSGFFYNLNYKPWAICLSYPAPYNITLLCFGRNYYLFPYSSSGCILGIDQLKTSAASYQISPNPFLNTLNISGFESKPSIELVSILGEKQSIEISESGTGMILNTEHIRQGIYILLISSNGQTYSRKVIKTN
jgi:hypothetical protein